MKELPGRVRIETKNFICSKCNKLFEFPETVIFMNPNSILDLYCMKCGAKGEIHASLTMRWEE